MNDYSTGETPSTDPQQLTDLLERIELLEGFRRRMETDRFSGATLKPNGIPRFPVMDVLPATVLVGGAVHLRDATDTHTYIGELVAGVATWVKVS